MKALDGWNEALVRLRKRTGLSQAEAAAKVRLSGPQLSRYESGSALPSLRTLGRILDVYGADLATLGAEAKRCLEPEPLVAMIDACSSGPLSEIFEGMRMTFEKSVADSLRNQEQIEDSLRLLAATLENLSPEQAPALFYYTGHGTRLADAPEEEQEERNKPLDAPIP